MGDYSEWEMLRQARYEENKRKKRVSSDHDWRDPEDVNLKRAENRKARKEEQIKRQEGELRCPDCLQMKLKMRSWVQINGRFICQLCWKSDSEGRVLAEKIMVKMWRYIVDRRELRRALRDSRQTMSHLATVIGWSTVFISTMEDVSEFNAQCLETGLKRINAHSDEVFKGKYPRFRIKADALRALREERCTRKELSDILCWSCGYIRDLEDGRRESINAVAAQKLIRALEATYKLGRRAKT